LINQIKYLINSLQHQVLPEIEKEKELIVVPVVNRCLQSGTFLKTGQRGRPSFDIDIDQVIYLKCLGFKWKQIANLIGVSVCTLHRRRQEYNVGEILQFTMISDEELCSQLTEIKKELPDVGERMIVGILPSKGLLVQRQRVRQALHLVDPINTSLRWHTRIRRRIYSVPGSMSLWHIE
jgi:hypothetical protein